MCASVSPYNQRPNSALKMEEPVMTGDGAVLHELWLFSRILEELTMVSHSWAILKV